jgi:uncharacterized membrane protein
VDQPPEHPEESGRELAEGAHEALEAAPEHEGPRRDAAFQVVGAHYSGPLPPPRMLEEYNSVLPGLAERIVNLAENDQRHVHKMDRGYLVLRFTGQVAALLIALAGLVIGGLLIADGHNIEGLTALIIGLAPVIGAFLYRQIRHPDEAA